MKSYIHPIQKKVLNNFSSSIEFAIKELLEQKHIYQNILLKPNERLDIHLKIVESKLQDTIINNYEHIINGNWFPSVSKNPHIETLSRIQKNDVIFFNVPDVKMYCKVCNRVEAFNLNECEDFLHLDENINTIYRLGTKTIQNFVLSYTCQSCKQVPEVFIIRRESFKLFLCGRAPIEYVDVPKIIPKNIRDYFSNALLAYQSGQTLSGLFYLRTLIEQWAYSLDTKNETVLADDAIEKYMQTLPNDFKNRFPSFRELYSALSLALHKATGSNELFIKTKDQIIEHFEARKLFKI